MPVFEWLQATYRREKRVLIETDWATIDGSWYDRRTGRVVVP